MPRAGYSSGGAFNLPSTPFTDPFGDEKGGGVYRPPAGSSGGSSGLTPGGFGVDVTSPQAFVSSMQQNVQEGGDFLTGLGAALFGKDNGSMFGGLPVVGDLGRFIGDNPVSYTAFRVPGGVADVVGGGLERVSLGFEDLTPRYQQLPDDLRAEFDKRIAENPDIANHLRYEALKQHAEQQQYENPTLHPTIDIPRGSLADTAGWMLGDLLGGGQREVERKLTGLTRASGMDRLQEIEAIAAGGVPTGVLGTGFLAGDRELSDVEAVALSKWKSGEWSHDQALTFLAASSSGLSHDKALQIAGTFATDPFVIGSLGAAGLARLGVTGAKLAATEAATGQRLLAGSGRFSGTQAGTEVIRLLSKPYQGIQGTSLGQAAKVTRYIIDPLHAIGQKRTASEALVDIVSDAMPRAVAGAYGEGNHLGLLTYARKVGSNGELYDMITEDIATYGANVGRRVLAEQHQAATLSQGLGYELVQSVPGDIIDSLAKNAPKDIGTLVRDEVAKHRILIWDEPARRNLAQRAEAMYGFKSADEFMADFAGWSEDQLGLLHAATYGRATKNLLNALGEAQSVYTGKVPLSRLVLLNRDTLTDIGAKGLLETLNEAELSQAAIDAGFKSVDDLQAALIKDMQARYPELRYITIDSKAPSRSVARFTAWLDQRVNSGVLPSQITRDEMAKLPESLQKLDAQMHESWTLGFRPEDEFLWGLEFNLDGTYRAATVPWVDHVADATPAFRAGRALTYNIAGQPLIGAAVRGATKPIDYMEAGLRTMRAKVTSAAITESARSRFIARAVGSGMTDGEAREVFEGILDAAQVHNTTARGLREVVMWEEVRHLVPQRLYQMGYRKRELMADVLDAYEGDLRFVGLTQKFTGRAKKLLQPLGGNVAGYVAENLYPTVKFRLNAIFQVQERIEPIVLNAQRGVTPTLGNKMSKADRLAEGINQRLVETSVVRAGDIDQLEFSAMSLIGDEAKQVLTGSVPRDFWNTLSDVQGVKRVNMLRTFQKGLGTKLREVWERNAPGTWDDIVNEYSAKAGRVISDDEAAVRYMSEQMLSNEVSVNRIIKPGATAADFDAAINTAEWHVPATLGELKPLDLDFMAKRLQLPVADGKVLLTSGDIRAALADGRLDFDVIEDALTLHGAHPDYIRRVQNALEFSWSGFWNAASKRYNLSATELSQVQRMIVRSAEVRGMPPTEFVSQVFSPMIGSGTEAVIEELGKAVSILRAPMKKGKFVGDAETLMTQLADVFTAHLDPSAQRTLLEAFERELPGDIQAAMSGGKVKASQAAQKTLENLRGGWGKWATDEFARRVLNYAEPPPGTVYYRGSDAAGTALGKRIRTGDDWWDDHLFMTADTAGARMYGSDIEKIVVAPDARILKEGTPEFRGVIDSLGYQPVEVLRLDHASEIARRAESLGYDVVHFSEQEAIGTVVLNEAKVSRHVAIEADPDVIRAVQQFSKWSKSALTDGLLSAGTPNPYSELLTRVAGIQTDLAAPFNYTEQMLVNQAAQAMRLKEQDAFRLQYFARDRSWLERSVNHPFFGIYPASYMWGKIAPEMIRFVAKEPFGIKTGAAAYTLADVQKAMAIQREFDPEFDAQMEKMGHSQAVWFAGYLLPAVPWDIGAAMPAWMRDIAAQGLANDARVAKGRDPKPIDLTRPVRKVADYVSPFRSVFQVDRVLDEVLQPPEPPKAESSLPARTEPIGPTPATNLGPTLEDQMRALTQVLAGQ